VPLTSGVGAAWPRVSRTGRVRSTGAGFALAALAAFLAGAPPPAFAITGAAIAMRLLFTPSACTHQPPPLSPPCR
jgi:hypothetical protein